MATRSITDPKDRLTTILIAPLMTCSARLPVYGVIIAAVIPNRRGAGRVIGLQGLVLFALYVAGIVGAMVVALILRGTITKGKASGFHHGDAQVSDAARARSGWACGSAPGSSCAARARSSFRWR
jgi:Fe2+ transport system protein B